MKNLNIKKLYALLIISVLFIVTAKAQIVYTDVNPDSTITTGSSYTIKIYNLDLNNDGTVDFNILTYHTPGGFYVYPRFYVKVTPLNANEVLDDSLSGSVYYPGALGLNSFIETNLLWSNTSNQILYYSLAAYQWGFWSLNTDGYLGLKVIVASDTLYGWVRLSIKKNNASSISFKIKDYAYNSIPNQPILAGETTCTTPTVNLTQSGPLSFCAGDSVTLTANGTGYKYQWKKNGVNISGAKSQTYIAKTAGIYKCKVTNSCGSKLSTGKTVSVPCRLNNENFVETFEHLSVYPNPANNSVIIKFPSDEEVTVEIINLLGEIIFSEKIIAEQTQIDVSKFSAGMYVVRWSVRTPSENRGKNNETKTFSIVK
ncbi:MAG: T9SS type A sorting domain-containing protein [Bacteroidia bacterium]